MTFNYLAGILLMFPLFCFTLLPFINGDFTTDNLTYKLNDGLAWGGLQMALVWIWIMIWSTAPEAAATFAPEYKDTARDTRKALISSAFFILFVNTMVPHRSHRRRRSGRRWSCSTTSAPSTISWART